MKKILWSLMTCFMLSVFALASVTNAALTPVKHRDHHQHAKHQAHHAAKHHARHRHYRSV
ncbi:MAG TPA: hypothetical protein VJP02_10385 [Candidatus Sulfotelmatobacter sp.]|nr:hypothetical protein [Candidatus Sulfotelmatobacter sp.]